MKRHYFVVEDVAQLKRVKAALEAAGIPDLQLHVLSQREADLEIHQLRPVADFMKTDVIHRTLQGLIIGLVIAAAVLATTAVMGWSEQVGWTPFLFLAIVALGFATWEGGFLGFQQKNQRFSRFQRVLQRDNHLLFVDVTRDQEPMLSSVVERFTALQPAGEGDAMPDWVVKGQQHLRSFMRWAP